MKRWAKADKNQPPVTWRLTILLWVLTEYLSTGLLLGATFDWFGLFE